MNLIGDVEGKNVLIRDDMVDTGGSLVSAADFLKSHGALSIYAAATHGVLSGGAVEKIGTSPIKRMIITDSIDQSKRSLPEKFEIISCSELIAEAVHRICDEESVSSLFKEIPLST
jgi:ribose-phosphate pyrophosphokinase